MNYEEVFEAPWTRKHDNPEIILIPQAPRIVYAQSLEELIALCKERAPGQRFKAAGSHWALSQAAISDHTFIETHDPQNVHSAMGRTIPDVIPDCLTTAYIHHLAARIGGMTYLVHVEAGKRIYQLYAELDAPTDPNDPKTLAGRIKVIANNAEFTGPWAFATLGGAGGQTVVGALSTGTHGGDFDRPPIADSVAAIHLVADGGFHFWIEPLSAPGGPLVEDAKLREIYGKVEYGGPENFKIIRDNHLFDAVLVSAGRFGIIYSVVMKAVPQYSLYERRRLDRWQNVKAKIKERDVDKGLFKSEAILPGASQRSSAVVGPQRFLQVAICLTPIANFQDNLVGITQRWELALGEARGRAERVGRVAQEFNFQIKGPAFENAGRSHPFKPDEDHPEKGAEPSLLERACADPSFLRGLLKAAIDEVEGFVASGGVLIGAGMTAIGMPGGIGLLSLIPAFLLILEILRELLEDFDDGNKRLGEHLEDIKGALLGPPGADAERRAAGVFAWQQFAYLVFKSEQADLDFDAISYAMMDRKDYLGRSCEVNVDSLEVFFDATDERLIAFVDLLIEFERQQEYQGKAFVGYASLRFTGPTRALLGMQRFATTCAIEVACLRDVVGSQELIDYAITLARNFNIDGILHWGQRNDYIGHEVERIYGDGVMTPGGKLGLWRKALGGLTLNGLRDGFSSDFTRRTGLEVVQPETGSFSVGSPQANVGDMVTISWHSLENPAGTEVRFDFTRPDGQASAVTLLPSFGTHQFRVEVPGNYQLRLTAHYSSMTGVRTSQKTASILVT